MRYVELARQRILLVAAACGAVAGVVIGLFLPIRATPPPKSEALQWSVPSEQSLRRFDPEQYESLKTSGFWNTQPTARGGGGVRDWTLRAIMIRPVAQVSVSVPGKNTQAWVRLGGTLPDGAILVSVDRDAIRYELDGCRGVKRLYAAAGGKPSIAAGKDDQACEGQAQGTSVGAPPRPAPNTAPEQTATTLSNGT